MLPANTNVGTERPVEVKNLLPGYPGECRQSHTAVSHGLSINSLMSFQSDKLKITGPDLGLVRAGSRQVIGTGSQRAQHRTAGAASSFLSMQQPPGGGALLPPPMCELRPQTLTLCPATPRHGEFCLCLLISRERQ